LLGGLPGGIAMLKRVVGSHLRSLACLTHNVAIATAERVHPFTACICPCCGWTGFAFRAFALGRTLRAGVVCPGCGSFERHRALAFFYPAFFAELRWCPTRLIHCAPEVCLAQVLARHCERYETSVFGEKVPADHRLNLRAIALPDASCDALVMNHVLDCMRGDEAASREMYRVLRPGGLVIAVVTFGGAVTREVPRQHNSLCRVYGSADVAQRFAPFAVRVVDAVAAVPTQLRRVSGIPDELPVLVLMKP
jgi:hypothetical protein